MRVEEVLIHPHALHVKTGGDWITFAFRDFADSQEGRVERILRRLRKEPPLPLIVGEREFCTDHRYVTFFCNPTLKIFTPRDPDDYAATYIYRIDQVLRKGGYATLDRS